MALVVALNQQLPLPAEFLRALANLLGVAAMLALHRGVRLFVDAPLPTGAHALALVTALVVSWLSLRPENAVLRVSLNAAVLVTIAVAIAADLYRYGRRVVRKHQAWLLAVPLAAAAAGFSLRGVRALLRAQSPTPEMVTDSAVNVVAAVTYMAVALTFQVTLLGLVVGRILADLRYRSRHDGLTGLLNRQAMEEALLTQAQRSRRNGEPAAVLMLDHFKAINDRHGHRPSAIGHRPSAIGRRPRAQATALKSELREIDPVGRFGGEEFLILMPGATVETALPVAERLRTALVIASPLIEDATLLISASIGIAKWREPAEEPSRLLIRADAALYQAKLRGRDRVAVENTESEPIARLAGGR